jgi:hypothetical protein
MRIVQFEVIRVHAQVPAGLLPRVERLVGVAVRLDA